MALSGEFLSGSINGRGIKVVPTATLGTVIHAASATATDWVTIYARNHHTAPVKLTLEFGGVAVPDDTIEATLPVGQLTLIVPKHPLSGSLIVTAFADTANVVVITGSVDRVT